MPNQIDGRLRQAERALRKRQDPARSVTVRIIGEGEPIPDDVELGPGEHILIVCERIVGPADPGLESEART